MGYSRASKESMALNGTIPKSRYKDGGNVDHSRQEVEPKKSDFNNKFPISKGKKITKSVLSYRNP